MKHRFAGLFGLILLCPWNIFAQDGFIPPEQLREQVTRNYDEKAIIPAGYVDSSRLFDPIDRPSLMDKLVERWNEGCDPEIPIAYWQAGPAAKGEKAAEPKKKAWYEKLSLRGYTQLRYNFTIDRDQEYAPTQLVADRSVGKNQSFILRRVRVILFGDLSEHMGVYIQPDFAATPDGATTNIQFTQIRDWYADWYLDKEKVFRLRLGQSKVPFGWENLQSSSNRLGLDRTDGMNSAVRNERDLGLFFYWTPEYAQQFFKDVMDQGLKGSGNYGLFGVGVYNGQGGSLAEQNDYLHSVIRLTLPVTFDNGQYMELGVQAYSGYYVVLSSQIRANGAGPLIRPAGTLETGDRQGWLDQRIGGTFIWYPQPIGFQAEWNVGQGPALNAAQNAIEDKPLTGGYLQLHYKYDTPCHGTMFPFTRWAYFNGGYKPERNAPYSLVSEWEVGLEWQINPQIELTTMYTLTDRTNTTALTDPGAVSYEQFKGQLMRVQLQFNY